jgi:hypothetical protein
MNQNVGFDFVLLELNFEPNFTSYIMCCFICLDDFRNYTIITEHHIHTVFNLVLKLSAQTLKTSFKSISFAEYYKIYIYSLYDKIFNIFNALTIY